MIASLPVLGYWNVLDFHAVEENMRHAFRLFASSRSSGDLREMPGVTIASSGVMFSMFNAAFLATPVEADQEMDRRIVTAGVHFGARGVNWSYWVCEGWLEARVRRNAEDLFAKHHLYLAATLPGMVAERVTEPARALPALDIRRVGDGPTWNAFCDIGSACFQVPIGWFREVFEEEGLWKNGLAGYVGYRDGEAVATAATVTNAGVVGVYNVGTLPGHQRRGYAETMMRHVLDRAREEHGVERTILQSTKDGMRLYKRMGYAEVTKVAVYTT